MFQVELFNAVEQGNLQNDREANDRMNCVVKAFCKAPFADKHNGTKEEPVGLPPLHKRMYSGARAMSTIVSMPIERSFIPKIEEGGGTK